MATSSHHERRSHIAMSRQSLLFIDAGFYRPLRVRYGNFRHSTGRWSGGGSEVTFLNFGHPAPMLVRPDGSAHFPRPPQYALPLGLGVHGAEGPEPYTVGFEPGDQILLYTDGVTEARDRAGDFYPLGDRASLLKDPDPEAALRELRADLVHHAAGPLHDDAAMLLLRHRHEEPPGTVPPFVPSAPQ
ncbi:hypothetical protein CG723_28470 [Streptomyces sp. CB01635]|nr:hypothetical protein CG723_28470 [Streptomyces sp. CB01635]